MSSVTDRRRFLLLAALAYGTVGLLAAAWIAWRRGGDGLVSAVLGTSWQRGAAGGLGVGLAVVGATRLAWLFSRRAREAEDALRRLIGPLRTVDCVVLALLSGVAEELLFRGVVQPWVGLVAASLLFGLVHVPPSRELAAWPLLAAGVGLLLGWSADRTGGLLAPMVAHVTINVLNLRHACGRRGADREEMLGSAGEESGQVG